MSNNELRTQILNSEITQLENQIAQYEKQKKQIDVQIEFAGIKLNALKEQLLLDQGDAGGQSGVRVGKPELSGLGFRESVIAVLRSANRGLQPKEIAQRMLEYGYRYSATTPLSTRLSNDLAKMKQVGTIRHRGGRYSIN